MTGSTKQQIVRSKRQKHRPARVLWTAAATLALSAALAGLALAANTVTIGSASISTLEEQIAVNSSGRTLYALSPETTSHLLCKSKECLKFWPPVTVSSRAVRLKAGPGVHGHLGIMRRSNGMLQVTLRGLPLYRFAEDHAKGQTHGQGIESFGGTWHAVTASSNPTPTMTAPPATPTPPIPPASPTPPAPPGYGY
jgi:predicted lipoprotein with Yx(FWY)xxD motif